MTPGLRLQINISISAHLLYIKNFHKHTANSTFHIICLGNRCHLRSINLNNVVCPWQHTWHDTHEDALTTCCWYHLSLCIHNSFYIRYLRRRYWHTVLCTRTTHNYNDIHCMIHVRYKGHDRVEHDEMQKVHCCVLRFTYLTGLKIVREYTAARTMKPLLQ